MIRNTLFLQAKQVKAGIIIQNYYAFEVHMSAFNWQRLCLHVQISGKYLHVGSNALLSEWPALDLTAFAGQV